MRQAAALAAMAFALATTVPARAETSPDDIVARGAQRLGWITTRGPDDAGRYSVAIDIAGIDPATPEGWARIGWRVDHGVGQLCDRVGAKPMVAGYYDPVQRECLNDGRAQAQVQMEQARAAALRGEKVAMLGFGFGG